MWPFPPDIVEGYLPGNDKRVLCLLVSAKLISS